MGSLTFNRRLIDPPPQLYVTADDYLFVYAISSHSSPGLELRTRTLDVNGKVITGRMPIIVDGVRNGYGYPFPLSEGFLLSACVVATSASVYRGQVYCNITMRRGGGASATTNQELWAGYVTANVPQGFPTCVPEQSVCGPGIIRSITGTDQAAGSEISETVPTGARWRLHAMRFTLATSAVVAARQVGILIDDGVNGLSRWFCASTQAASLSINYTAGPWGITPATIGSDNLITTWDPVILMQGWRIRTLTLLRDAGDNFTAPQILVEEWLEP